MHTINNVGNVVANVNSVMADLWSYDSNGDSRGSGASSLWSPSIVYGDVSSSNDSSVVRPMTLSSVFASVNMDYQLEFPRYVGQTNAPSSGEYSFFANIGTDGLVGNASASNIDQFNLDNNGALNDILLQDVSFTEFTVSANSYKYTDIGAVIPHLVGNTQFNAVLPFVGNTVSDTTGNVGYNLGDVAMNVIVDYFQNPTLLSGDVDNIHRLTIYDVQYRFALASVMRSGAAPLNTKLTINGKSDLITNLMTHNEDISSVVSDNLSAPEFTLYTYDNVTQYSSSDTLYPFTTVTGDQDRWFPGFNYRNGAFYSSKTDIESDFTINTNTDVEANVSFLFQNVNTQSRTISVAKSSDNTFKSIPIRSIRFGSDGPNPGSHPLYGWIVVKVLGETSSYVVILYKLNSAGTNYADTVNGYLPVIVNVKSIEMSEGSNPKQQVEYKSALRVYNSSGALVQSFSNTVTSRKSPLSLFDYSSAYGSNNSNVGVNIYAAPPSNAIMQWAYKQSMISLLVNYSVVNYSFNPAGGYIGVPLQTGGSELFAATTLNSSYLPQTDANAYLPLIPALSRRCYLDVGFGNGVYVDIANSYISDDPIVFTVDRSVEWVLKRKTINQTDSEYETVGRGLISHARNESSTYDKYDYLIIENDTTYESSGFQMIVNTNVIDLSARLLAQSISTGDLLNGDSNEMFFTIHTVPDTLTMVIYKVNPVSGVEDQSPYSSGSYNTFNADSDNIDLAQVMSGSSDYNGQLPSFTLSVIRGYQFGEVTNRDNALFSVSYSRDNYAVIQLFYNATGTYVIGGRLENDISTFNHSNGGGTTSLYCSAMDVNFNNVADEGTLNTTFTSVFAPLGVFSLFASYTHNGFGSVSYGIADFTSNYGKTLPTQVITPSTATPVFELSSDDAYNVSTPIEMSNVVQIRYDADVNKYYILIDAGFNQADALYFRGVGHDVLPIELNGANTVLLYTGTRPIIVSTLTMAEGANLTNVIDGAVNVSSGMFTNTSWLTYTESNILSQTYAVFFTNAVGAVNRSAVDTNVRSLTVVHTNAYFSNTGNFYLGAYINSSNLLTDNVVTVKYTNGSYSYPFDISKQLSLATPVQADDVLDNGINDEIYTTYVCSNTYLNELFKLALIGSVSAQPYSINIEPAHMHIYAAIDTNNNDELDNSYNTTDPDSFGLDAAFSELLYTLTPVVPNSRLNVPNIVDSWTLDGNFHNIKGSSLDIKMNVKWNIGYNLSNFFTIRQNNAAKFDVITIHTEYNSSMNGKTLTNLVVSPTKTLIVGNKNNWAHSATPPTNGEALTGLSFKIKSTVGNVNAGDVVRLFVDNQVAANNTLAFNVGAKTYRLSSYDQERYAALLDEQIRYTNNLE